jgi:iron(III) transport system ATP-binding protein
MKALQRRLGVTTIMVTHDQEEALTMADRIVVMNHGVIEQVGTPTEIYREPDTLFVADFIGEMNQIPGRVSGDNRVVVGNITLDTQPNNLESGGSAIVAIRPEDIIPHNQSVHSEGDTESHNNAKNTFKAEVNDMEFLGSFWRVSMNNEELGDVTLIADMSINAVRRMSIAVGESVLVELPANRIWVFQLSNS